MGNDNSREKIIKEVITDEINNINIPTNAKQNSWEKIQGELNKKNTNLHTSKKSNFFKVMVGVAASILLFFVLVFSSTNNSGTAFFWQ